MYLTLQRWSSLALQKNMLTLARCSHFSLTRCHNAQVISFVSLRKSIFCADFFFISPGGLKGQYWRNDVRCQFANNGVSGVDWFVFRNRKNNYWKEHNQKQAKNRSLFFLVTWSLALGAMTWSIALFVFTLMQKNIKNSWGKIPILGCYSVIWYLGSRYCEEM